MESTKNFGYNKLYIDGQLVDAECNNKAEVFCPANGKPITEIDSIVLGYANNV
jgi:succinate-semialdehyde dehydrogenase/glutarate-semialdehyde dehydrogenase